LRNITQQELNEESSDAEDDLEGKDNETQYKMRQKRKEMARWLKFCKSKVEKIEKVWNRKLEDPRDETDDASSNEPADDSRDEDHSDDPFGAFMPREMMSKSMILDRGNDLMSRELQEVVDGMLPLSKDDTDRNIIPKDFNQHEFW